MLHPVVSDLSWFLHHHEISGLDPRSREALASDREAILDQLWPVGYPSAQSQVPGDEQSHLSVSHKWPGV